MFGLIATVLASRRGTACRGFEQAVREKLAGEERRAEFYRLSDEPRRRMDETRVSESEILSDFEAFREGLTRD